MREVIHMKKKGLKRFISKCLAACLTVTIMATGGFGTMVSKAGQREDVVALARSQVGYHEKASNANLDDYTANSGSGNFTKYARDLGVGNGQPWCAYFVWWVLQSSGVDSNAYPRTGWVPTIAQWFKNAGLYYPSGGSYVPNPGDIVIFGSGNSHVGMVEYVDRGYVHCIEGNAGDCVKQTSYNLYTSSYMRGFGAVNYRPSDTTKPTITDVKVTEQTANTYTVQCTATDDVSVAKVQFPTWTEKNGQDDIRWDTVTQSDNGVYTYTVNIADHGNEEGVYNTHIYAYDSSGNISDCHTVQVTMDKTAPSISVVEIREITTEGFKLRFEASDALTGVQHVGCLAYTNGNESSIPEKWYEDGKNFATNVGGDKWEYEVKIADHDNARGSYDVRLLAYDKCNNVCEYIIKDVVVPEPENVVSGSVAGDIANNPTISEAPDYNTGNEWDPEDATSTDGQPEDTTTEVQEPAQNDTTPDDTTGDTNIVIDTNINVENNYTTITNNYISNNTYIQNGVTYTASDIPVLDSVSVADTYVAPTSTQVGTNPSQTVEQLMDTNPAQAVSGALTQYAGNCAQSAQENPSNTTEEIEGEQEQTELVNTLSQLQAEAGEKTSVSYTTTIDGRKVTFTITLK
jgi:hypothetical protein